MRTTLPCTSRLLASILLNSHYDVGLPVSHPASFRKYLRERLINKTGLTKYHFLHGEGGGPQVVRKNSAELKAAPIDVAFVGIGENGHLAFKRSTGRFPNRGTLSHAQKEERQSLKVQDFER